MSYSSPGGTRWTPGPASWWMVLAGSWQTPSSSWNLRGLINPLRPISAQHCSNVIGIGIGLHWLTYWPVKNLFKKSHLQQMWQSGCHWASNDSCMWQHRCHWALKQAQGMHFLCRWNPVASILPHTISPAGQAEPERKRRVIVVKYRHLVSNNNIRS